MMKRVARRNHWALFIAGLLLGCGGQRDIVPVYGTVTIDGRPRPEVCRLFFHPAGEAGGRPSAAETDQKGAYRVKSYRGADGMPPGTYQVRVTYFDLKPGGDPNNDASWIPHDYEAGEVVVDADSSGVEYHVTVPAQS